MVLFKLIIVRLSHFDDMYKHLPDRIKLVALWNGKCPGVIYNIQGDRYIQVLEVND